MAPDPQGTVPGVPDIASSSGPIYRRRFITLRAEHSLEELDLELPADRKIVDLIPEIVRALGWPEASAGETIEYQVFREAGELLDEAATLSGVGVENSDVLWIRVAGEASRPAEGKVALPAASGGPKKQPAVPMPVDPSADSQELRGSLPPPLDAGIEIARPSIVSRQGFVFELKNSRTLIGRSGRGYEPDVDLTDLDPEFAASRRHAVIEAQGGEFEITALRTTNGTYVNGVELASGTKHRLSMGDEIQFGSEGVKLTFLSAGHILSSSFFK
jgi:hypothetical protein